MNGLSSKEVINNRLKYGSNTLTKHKPKTLLSLILESFSDPIIKILLIVLGIKIIMLFKDFDWYETIGILISIILSSTIGAISEHASDMAFNNLEKEATQSYNTVIRNKKLITISSKDIVVGDLVKLYSGEKVPADGIIKQGEVTVNESIINGESKDKIKTKSSICYSGTIIYDGECILEVKKVGDKTELGQLAKELQTKDEISPLKKRLTNLAKIISFFGYIGAILTALIYLLSTKNFSLSNLLYALTLGVTVIVVAVPEGLPMMITLVLSSNMKKMLKSNILVRKLVGIETSGNINVLLTDKTGTLTNGQLSVEKYISPTNKYYENISTIPSTLKEKIINSIYLNNSSYFTSNNKIEGGNQTDKSLLKFCGKQNIDNKVLAKELFNSKNKYSSITTNDNVTYFKGAKEVILNKCLYYFNESGKKALLFNKEKISEDIDNIAERGSRVIVLASKENYYQDKKLESLTYLGIIIINDQVRDTSASSINTLHEANINVIMVTGDALNTAKTIAKQVNIIKSNSDIALTSEEFNKLSDDEIFKIYPNIKVIARALPKDKSRLVTILKKHDLVVGMTGDGINDASALKKADVGFAMGSGTSVAKEASDIIILDDNIKSITSSVLFGRTIYKSIRKFIIFQLTVNICAMIMAIIGPIISISTPVTIMQMLWINMIMDTLAGVAFASEPPLTEYMQEPPKKLKEPIINKYMYGQIIITGLYSALIGILFLKVPLIHQLIRYSKDNRYILTAYFALFIFTGIFNALNARTSRINIFANISKNKPFIFIFSFIILAQIYLIYLGGPLFRTYGLTIKEFIYILIFSLTVIPFDIIRKIKSKKRFDSI